MRGDFYLDDWLVQPQLNLISRVGCTVRVEPKAMLVLLSLSRQQDEVVSKEALEKAVWPNTFVTDHFLIRCISDLRQAFRDDPRNPKILGTINRRGYWLIPPVVRVPDVPAINPNQTAVIRTTVEPKAYEAYLKARHCANQFSNESLTRAVFYFKQAIAFEPAFALAHSGLADAFCLMAQRGMEDSERCYRLAKATALRAIDLGERAAEPRVSLALAVMSHDLNWRAAEHGFRAAIEMDPTCAAAYHWLALCLLAQGRFEEATREAVSARDLDPLSRVFRAMLARILLFTGKCEAARDLCLESLELNPEDFCVQLLLAECYWRRGHSELALARLRAIGARGDEDLRKVQALAAVFCGPPDRAATILRRTASAVNPAESADAAFWARLAAMVGENDVAIRWLETALERREPGALLLNVDPAFNCLRADARFPGLVARLHVNVS